jgi:SOS-response transcriptional repressor LexA
MSTPPTVGMMALRIKGNSMQGAGISHGDDVIVQRQQTAEDNDIVLVATW